MRHLKSHGTVLFTATELVHGFFDVYHRIIYLKRVQ